MEKYKLREDLTIKYFGKTLYRIEALKNFGDVYVGELGGYVEKEENLSDMGDCWIFGDGKVFDNASVYHDAQVCDNAMIYGNAHVYGNAQVCDTAQVFDNAHVYGNAEIYKFGDVCGDARICGNAKISRHEDYFTCKHMWHPLKHITYTRSNKMWNVDLFYGTGDDLVVNAYREDGDVSGERFEKLVKYVEEMYEDLENKH